MKKSYILVIDSGVGGVSILKELVKKYKDESFIYVADNLNSPYGNKTKKFLRVHILKLINEYIQKYSIKLIVFACNTITAATINFVRKNIDIPIVGTEPPIKQVKNNKKTLVLATISTIKYSNLLKIYKNKKNIDFIGLKNVANMLDDNFYERKLITDELKKQIPNKEYKFVVLGCTHYYFLKKEITKVLHKVKFYDATFGVVKQVKKLLTKTKKSKQSIKIKLTKNNNNLKNSIKYILNS